MFEPENDIERSLVRAASGDRQAQATVVRELLQGNIWWAMIVHRPGGMLHVPTGPIWKVISDLAGPDGMVLAPAGSMLEVATARRRDRDAALIACFTAPSRAREWVTRPHIVIPDNIRDAYARPSYAGQRFVLNPGSSYCLEFGGSGLLGSLLAAVRGS